MSQDHEQLTQLIPCLSPLQAREVLTFTQALLGQPRTVDEAFCWSAEDMEDVTRAAIEYANEIIPFEEAGSASSASQPPASAVPTSGPTVESSPSMRRCRY